MKTMSEMISKGAEVVAGALITQAEIGARSCTLPTLSEPFFSH